MKKLLTIAVDAMGGDNSPKKVLLGISEFLKKDHNVFFKNKFNFFLEYCLLKIGLPIFFNKTKLIFSELFFPEIFRK